MDSKTDENTTVIDIVYFLEKALEMTDNKIFFKLNNNEILFVKQMMKEHPESFQKISNQVNSILQSKQLEIKDIPELIYIIAVIYINDFQHKNINIIDCIQFTLDTIINSGLLPINTIEQHILQSIVDSSLKLLKTNLPMIEESIINAETVSVNFISKKSRSVYKYFGQCLKKKSNTDVKKP